ncbi:hypothetical protein [Pantoea ananatis]|uniref:hypothetical protein n=1 Tax=Pantoea ananas TaxID=553 RepID=UPI0015751591|nr:hypothetical protein [Pantoea ananatis]NQE77363.1 hypothetical protein [Pantoea ananatis]NQE81906.1 hypothetical protein [Pantoea ananatis]
MTIKFHEKEIKKIITIIETWNKSNFNWKLLCLACKPVLGRVPTRQGLSKHSEIASAYLIRKRSKSFTQVNIKLPGSLAIAAKRINSLEIENSILKEENANLLLTIKRMHENAFRNNILPSILDEEIPRRLRK